jgi:hypothetical protein
VALSGSERPPNSLKAGGSALARELNIRGRRLHPAIGNHQKVGKMKRKIDHKKILQILSVYLLALAAAVIGGSHHSGSKAVAQTQTRQQMVEQVTGDKYDRATSDRGPMK